MRIRFNRLRLQKANKDNKIFNNLKTTCMQFRLRPDSNKTNSSSKTAFIINKLS